MATFPAFIPSDAPITPGARPATVTSSLNGAQSRIRHGSAEIGREWKPKFENITEAEFLLIVAHYRSQRSGFDSFGFDELTLDPDLTPTGYAWLYSKPPQIVDDHDDVFTVSCEFRCEPRGLVTSRAVRWRSNQPLVTFGTPSGGVTYGRSVAWATGATTFTPGRAPFPIPAAFWLDASDSSARTLVQSGGSSRVSELVDKAGNGWTVRENGDFGYWPTLASGAINGLDAVQWPSTQNNQRLYSSNTNTLTLAVVYLVVKWTGGPSFSGSYPGVLNPKDTYGATWLTGIIDGYGFFTSTFNQLYINNGATNKISNVFPDITSPCLIRISLSSGGTVTTSTGLVFGNDHDLFSSRGWHGLIGEAVGFATTPSAGDDVAIRAKLMTKWGIA